VFNPVSYAFGVRSIYESSPVTVGLRNFGPDPATVLLSTGTIEFFPVSGDLVTLPGDGSTVNWVFQLQPVAIGARNFTITITTDSFNTGQSSTSATCTGVDWTPTPTRTSTATLTPTATPTQTPQVQPSSGPVGTPFTIFDPQGRIEATDICVIYPDGAAPEIGTQVSVIIVDGTTVLGTIPVSIAPGSYLLTIRPSASEPAKFADLPFQVDI
jgi:hypothetical protein